MNKVVLIGRLTRDPELRYTSSNIPSATFSLAVNRPFQNQNGVREADFINIVMWRKQAETAKKYLTKGSLISIEGRIQTRNYDGADGKKVYVTEVVADNFEFLETKGQKTSTPMSDVSNDIEYSNAPSTNVSDEPYIDFGDTIELSDDDIAF
ncbi:MAG: single-stranded DNA-binding protein [Tenericutes bacterium]|jgi:single stranded DNA-binding protein (ssb)|nr:single-stranded DNA-binding protein [Mycoplasmatota bacterium]MDD7629974.1 single-stranded DNA-binding protein [bacterium]MDY4108759.1 single-stranded DNA-binding protein [Bacilli bacterium]